MAIRWMHEKGELLQDGSVTASEKVLGCCGTVLLFGLGGAIVVGTSPVWGLAVGAVYAIDACVNLKRDRDHRRRMERDWDYRLRHTAPPMSQARVWQDAVTRLDVCVLRVLAMRELGDVPREVWADLLSTPEREAAAAKLAAVVGTAAYTAEVRSRALDEATDYYASRLRANLALPSLDAAIVEAKVRAELFFAASASEIQPEPDGPPKRASVPPATKCQNGGFDSLPGQPRHEKVGAQGAQCCQANSQPMP